MSYCQAVVPPTRRFVKTLSLRAATWSIGVACSLMVPTMMAPAAIASLNTELSMEEARSKLSNLDELPLFLPSSFGKLVASSEDLSSTDISKPSLSWIRDQVGKRYGSDRLVTQWQAYEVDANARNALFYVDVVVDEQIWSLLSYFERYAFISQFGTVAQQYGYHLRVFHSGDVVNHNDAQSSGSNRLVGMRGAHVCNFQQAPDSATTPLDPVLASEIYCEVVFDDVSHRGTQ